MNTKDSAPTNPMDSNLLPEEVRGFDPQDYLAWKHHPMTKAVMRYYQDYRDQIVKDHQERWLYSNAAITPAEDELRYRAQVLDDLVTLIPERIVRFYVGDPPPSADPGWNEVKFDQTNQHGTGY